MGKPRDTKIAILPSTTRKGTTLSTSAALDSPSVIDKLVSPPHASRAGTSAESENSHNIDNVSAVLDDSGSLGSFLDATIAKSRQIENTETPNVATPVNSPESVDYSSDDLDEDYVELDNDFIEKCKATTDARKIKKLLAEHAVRYKPSPDPKFATSPINIRDKDYDFSLDLSHIAIVEKTPFCGTEKESAVEHLTELSTLSGVFSDDVKMRTYFVAKIFPFSLKDDAKTWYNNLPPGSIKSPKELLDVFFRKYFPASAQHAALQRIYNFDQEDGEKLPEAWARFCSLIRAQPDHDLEKHDLLDIFYSGLTIESRAYLDSCAGCVFRKRTPDDAEELLAKIGRNHDDWSTPEPTPTPIVKKRGMIKLNDEDMREAKKSLKEKGIKPEDVKNLPPIEDICETIPPSSTIEDPLYPEGHPKRVEQDSQPIKTSAPSKKKKKKHKNVVESSEPVNDPNSISISDAETESGNEHEEDNDKNDTPDKEEIEKEPEKPAKNKKYTKEDFITEKHGAVIDCNKGMVTFNVDDKEHTVYFPKRIDKMDGGERAKKPILSEMTSHSVTSDILDDKMDVGEGTKKRMLCEMTSKSVCSDIPDDKKHRVEENSILSDDKGEMACQSFKPPTPPCLLSMETDAAGPGTDEPIRGIIVPHEEGCGLGLPPAEETGGAAGAASVEPLVNGVVPREFSELEQDGLPIVKTDVTGADAGVATDDPAPEVATPPEGGFVLVEPVMTMPTVLTGGGPGADTGGLPGAGIVEISANSAVPPNSYELEHVPDVPSVEPDAPVSSGDDSAESDQEGSASRGQDVSCHSPEPELKSATVAYMARTVLQALKIQLGGSQDQLLQAIVTTKDQPACFVISCILFDKLKHCNWRIVQSHQHGERSYVYVKMIHADLVRFHDKMYGWGEARATFCSIHTVFALEPDPMDAYPVVQLS
ncbi:hypothetical protein QYE76_032186 [Lolium multiflorum]|uniref:Retrotransposon gag domain-containing protein n=1 Tax=Lolium multiflorum TaxID=4521 RepID=A0AAD8QT38_LOLMU|nr:hypothetical protein QYE76_032186 [Lolium multiflorum]